MATKKVKSAGRFGTRYGLKTRREVLDIDRVLKARHVCPDCARARVKRAAAGVWECRHCGLQFAGGTYAPTTAATKIIRGEVKAMEITAAPEKAELTETAEKKEGAKEEKPKVRKTRARKAKAEKAEAKEETAEE